MKLDFDYNMIWEIFSNMYCMYVCMHCSKVYISQLKNLGVIRNFIFTNGPVHTMYILDKIAMYLTKYSQLNFHECKFICEICKN